MSEIFSIALIFSTIRFATPLIFAALGGMFSERSGVINIALEGLLLAGAFTAAVITFETGNPFIGFLSAMLAGAALAAVYAVAVIKFEADQVVAGFGINILMLGLPALLSSAIYDSAGSTEQIAKENLLPDFGTFLTQESSFAVFKIIAVVIYLLISAGIFTWLRNRSKANDENFGNNKLTASVLAFVGSLVILYLTYLFLSSISIASFLAFLLVPGCWYVLYKTPFGLRLRAVGENPAAADAAGVSVVNLRYTGVILSGILAAAGGAYLSTGQSSLFTRGMSAGRGFIALAALILAKWRPVQVMFACLFFGFTEALTIPLASFRLASGETIPVQFIQIIPYVLTIIVLAGFIGLSRAPKALGVPYRKEK